jgi:plasmid stabilization system protein ParE
MSPAKVRRPLAELPSASGKWAYSIGRPGQVPGTFERVLADIPYVLVYSIDVVDDREVISILRVVHQAQKWPPEE